MQKCFLRQRNYMQENLLLKKEVIVTFVLRISKQQEIRLLQLLMTKFVEQN